MVDYRKRPVGSSAASYEPSNEDEPEQSPHKPNEIDDLPLPGNSENNAEIETTIQFTNEQTI